MNNKADSTPKRRFSRRDLLKLLQAGGLGVFLGGYISLLEPYWLQVTRLRLGLPRLPRSFDGFRLAQISDLHIGSSLTIDRMETVADRLLELKPEAVVITGDFVWGYGGEFDTDLPALGVILARIVRAVPVFAVLGNHDHWLGARAVRQMLSTAGVVELANRVQTLTRGSGQLHFCGVDDIYEHLQDLNAVLRRLPETGCALLLAHEPDFADQSALAGRFDLQLSGHSHGGQVVLPGYGPLVLPHLGRKYPLGLYRVGGMLQYTNRGLGTGKISLRFNCRPEITLFTLECAQRLASSSEIGYNQRPTGDDGNE